MSLNFYFYFLFNLSPIHLFDGNASKSKCILNWNCEISKKDYLHDLKYIMLLPENDVILSFMIIFSRHIFKLALIYTIK